MNPETNNRAFLGLGGNLGNPLENFITARQQLADHPSVAVIASSPLYRTPAIGGPEGQPDYLNAVLKIDTNLTPHELLELCQTIELSCGRTREVRWAARTLDIDLLFFGTMRSDDAHLTLPHPRLQERHFVLMPLVDLNPEWLHPRLKRTSSELLNDLPEPVGIIQVAKEW